MQYVLGIDFGGGSSKALLLSESGEIAAEASVEYPTYFPENGFCEQRPADWYDAACENIRILLEKSGVSSSDIKAMALDAATHTAVLCDENFNVLRDSVYWTDTRSFAECKFLREKYGDLILRQCYHSPDTIWTLPQLLWIKNHEPQLFSKVRKIMFAKDYVRHMLTGDFVTDNVEAEGSMLFDFETQSWSHELCCILGISPSFLPKIVKPYDMAGRITKQAALSTGLCEGMPVLCGTTDTLMEVFAAGGTKKGAMTVKLATAGRICVITDAPLKGRDFVNYSHFKDGLWYPGTATKSCAASLRWYRDTFGGKYDEMDNEAERIPAGAEGLLFHPYLNGELTPYADPELCASFVGIRAGHTKAHFTRALLEGVAFSLLECKNALDKKMIEHDSAAAAIGGGAKSPLWRQIVSDVLNIKLAVKNCSDSSLGSAMLAGVYAGFFDSYESALQKCTHTVSETVPSKARHEEYMKVFGRYKAVHDALAPIYKMK